MLTKNLRLASGKLRRLFYAHMGRAFVERHLERRQGECARCGACCRLLYNCPFLDETTAPHSCRIYERRLHNCRLFPFDEKDIEERDLVLPGVRCGFGFEKKNGHGERTAI